MTGTTVPTERAADAIPKSPLRVLVADPDPDTRTLYQTALRLCGCDVIEASDGRDALTKALVQPPTLVITELRLPFVDGFALCDILRRDPMTATVPILVVTGEARPAELQRVGKLGADAVLVKPITPEVFLTRSRELLAKPANGVRGSATDDPHERSIDRLARPQQTRRKPLAKAHLRCETTTPPTHPPALHCPSCDGMLRYERSYIGGVSSRYPEQWDAFSCACGIFEYRHRTRKLRRAQ